MLIKRGRLGGAFGLALIVAACSGSSAPGTSPATAASGPASSQPAATGPDAAQSSGAPVEPTAPVVPTAPIVGQGGAPELEAMLPNEVAGVPLQKLSFGGTAFAFDAGAPFDSSALEPLLKENGKTIEDVRLAIARPAGAKPGALGTMVMALQVVGLDAAKLHVLAGASSSMTPAVIGGKQVLQAGTAGFNVYVYAKGDILFEMMLADDTQAAAVLAALP
jgi:hypothetical protein